MYSGHLTWGRAAMLLIALCCVSSCVVTGGSRPEALVESRRSGSLSSEPVDPTAAELGALTEVERRIGSVYRTYNRGVVNVHSFAVAYTRFLIPYPMAGSGSGSIVHADGLVLTNNHVVAGAEQLFVSLYDGSVYPARVVGADPETDIAVVSFDPGDKDLTVIPIGSSSRLQVGQFVVALGNPFGLERTLTTGAISSLESPGGDPYSSP